MSIKESIKAELLKMISDEEVVLHDRIIVNTRMSLDNYDATCERNFLTRLKKFVESI